MKKFLVVLGIAISCLFAENVHAFNIYRVGDTVKGREYNEVWKSWFNKDFSIWVGISEEGEEYILFKAQTGLGDATVTTKYDKELKARLESLVTKSIEWSGVAKKNKADATKELGCFGRTSTACEMSGEAFEENDIGLSFFAANGGQQTNLIISIIDRDNQFLKATLYLELAQMKKFRTNISKIEETFKKAKKTAEKQHLFK